MHPSHFISSHVVFHLCGMVLNSAFFSLSHFLPYFYVNLPALLSTFILTFALLPFSSFITRVKNVFCDPRFLFGSILTKHFPCSSCHCCIKSRHTIINVDIRFRVVNPNYQCKPPFDHCPEFFSHSGVSQSI